MRESLFWKLMEFSRTAGSGGQTASLYRVLAASSAQEILSFAKIQQRKMHQLRTSDLSAAHIIIRGTASEDDFEAFTAWITAQGKSAYEQVRRSPSNLSRILKKKDVRRIDWKAYLVVAGQAYLDKAKKEDFWSRLAAAAPPELTIDRPKDLQSLQSRHPELFKTFWNPKYAASLPFRKRGGGGRPGPGYRASTGRRSTVAGLQRQLLKRMVAYMRLGSAESLEDPLYDPTWNAGYTQKHIHRCKAILNAFSNSLKRAARAKATDDILKAVKKAVLSLNILNRDCDGALIETDRREDLCSLIDLAARQAGLRPSRGDITEEWREW